MKNESSVFCMIFGHFPFVISRLVNAGKEGVYSVDNVVSQPSRKSKSGLLSKLGKAVRSGVAGAVALGSAYAMSMPQKANADLINITSYTDFVDNANNYSQEYPGSSAEEYNSQVLVNGQAPVNNLLIIFTKNYSELNIFNQPIGGFNAVQGSSSTSGHINFDDGFYWFGLNNGDSINTPISFDGSIRVYEDANSDGSFGMYNTDTGFFDFERLLAHTDPNAPAAGTMSVQGFDNFQGSGSYSQGTFNIIVPEPSTITLLGLGAGAATLAASRRRKFSNKRHLGSRLDIVQ
ncbi:MAG: PEP-CTERM sorting domain-containing protein [Kiritimatiellae bacterium]|nr:PEP-CTERM sorting domain-containing protein [Kiritimatiellia bacterium]